MTTSSGTVEIRPRDASDFEALVELDLASARHHAGLETSGQSRRGAPPWASVSECQTNVEGGTSVCLRASVDPDISNRRRGWGIGKVLMAAAERRARERGAERLILDMSAANEGALRFDHRLGYREYGLLLRRSVTDAVDG